MTKKFLIGLFFLILAAIAIGFSLGHEKSLVTHPKGQIAHEELELITTNVLLMLSICVPTYLCIWYVMSRFTEGSHKQFNPEHTSSVWQELIVWCIPSVIVAVMALITWNATHKLDPYKPIEGTNKPIKIQVVAINWKWLFIYPEQDIATVNFVQFPEKTPVQFFLAADNSPMNLFWIPELSGQISSMTGMVTQLHVITDGPGEYSGRAAEINGEGFADMTFKAKSTTKKNFDEWVLHVKESPLKLTEKTYQELLKSSKNHPITLYSNVEKDLFHKIVMKYMSPH